MLPIRQLLAERKMKSNSLLFLTSNRFGGVRKEGKFWVLNKFYNCYRTHRSGLVWLKWQFWVDGTFLCHHWGTMATINWVSCRFFICLYDLNTVCFLSSWCCLGMLLRPKFLFVYACQPTTAERTWSICEFYVSIKGTTGKLWEDTKRGFNKKNLGT